MLLENNPYPEDIRVRREAESLVAAGHSVEVIAPRDSGQSARETIDGVRVRRFRAYEARTGLAAGTLLEYLIAAVAMHLAALRALLRGATVLHIHNPPDLFFPVAAIYRLAGRMVVFDHHDLAPELAEVKWGNKRLVAVARLCERLTFATATHVIAANESHPDWNYEIQPRLTTALITS